MITFACVLKSPPVESHKKYTSEWVDKLYRGIARNYHSKFNFVCLSDCNDSVEYRVIPFESDSPGYWNKIELFRPGLFQGPVVYFDLDVVICNDITEALLNLPRDKFLLALEPHRDIHNSSMMFWEGAHDQLYEYYRQNQHAVISEYDHNLARKGCLGDQGYIGTNTAHDVIDNFVRPGFLGWIHHKVKTDLADPSVLIFTGTQKPSNNLHLDLVKKHWI